jgi:hypothetical protein
VRVGGGSVFVEHTDPGSVGTTIFSLFPSPPSGLRHGGRFHLSNASTNSHRACGSKGLAVPGQRARRARLQPSRRGRAGKGRARLQPSRAAKPARQEPRPPQNLFGDLGTGEGKGRGASPLARRRPGTGRAGTRLSRRRRPSGDSGRSLASRPCGRAHRPGHPPEGQVPAKAGRHRPAAVLVSLALLLPFPCWDLKTPSHPSPRAPDWPAAETRSAPEARTTPPALRGKTSLAQGGVRRRAAPAVPRRNGVFDDTGKERTGPARTLPTALSDDWREAP